MLGQLSGQDQADRCLDLTRGDGRLLVVKGKASSLSCHLYVREMDSESARIFANVTANKYLTLSKMSLMKEFMIPMACEEKEKNSTSGPHAVKQDERGEIGIAPLS